MSRDDRPQVLITGSEGLVGTALARRFERAGWRVRRLDLRGPIARDVLSDAHVADAIRGCRGIVHLAAVSRVIDGQRDPAACWRTNVGGTRRLLAHAARSREAAWFVFASSREVYGESERLPVTEDAPHRPMNVYARSKCAGERLVTAAGDGTGLAVAVARLSSVYGWAGDHPDRVVPAFCRAALAGRPLIVEGSERVFDFTHVRDVARGLFRLALALDGGAGSLPPLHFVSGRGTSLGELAQLVAGAAGRSLTAIEAPGRPFDVARFRGDPRRAFDLLGWRARVPLAEGLRTLLRDLGGIEASSRRAGVGA